MNARTRRTVAALILVWAFLLVVALVAHHRPVTVFLLGAAAAAAGIGLLVAAVRRGRRNQAGPPAGDQAGEVRVYDVPARPALRRPRRKRPDPPPPLTELAGVTGVAAARVDQELMRQRAAAGDKPPGYDDFVALMRGAGAGDLEDTAGDQEAPS